MNTVRINVSLARETYEGLTEEVEPRCGNLHRSRYIECDTRLLV